MSSIAKRVFMGEGLLHDKGYSADELHLVYKVFPRSMFKNYRKTKAFLGFEGEPTECLRKISQAGILLRDRYSPFVFNELIGEEHLSEKEIEQFMKRNPQFVFLDYATLKQPHAVR